MASASSVIRVSIIGDAKKLTGALSQADKATGGLLASTAKLAAGAIAIERVGTVAADFIGDSIAEFDRLGDATFNLTTQLGDLAGPLIDTADQFSRIGASKQDIIEMEARFADLATATGIADTQIAMFADDAAATAAAMALLSDKEPDVILDLIAKAAGGSAKAAKELGVSLLANVDPATQLNNILTQLKPKLDAATTGTMDLEQQQKAMEARIETLQAQFGEALNPVLLDFWEGLNLAADAMGGIPEDLKQIEDAARTLLAPLGNLNDLLGGIGDFFNQNHSTTLKVGVQFSDREALEAVQRETRRNSGPQGRD